MAGRYPVPPRTSEPATGRPIPRGLSKSSKPCGSCDHSWGDPGSNRPDRRTRPPHTQEVARELMPIAALRGRRVKPDWTWVAIGVALGVHALLVVNRPHDRHRRGRRLRSDAQRPQATQRPRSTLKSGCVGDAMFASGGARRDVLRAVADRYRRVLERRADEHVARSELVLRAEREERRRRSR